MTYFPNFSKVLVEGSFLAFISKVNEDFIAADKGEYEFYLVNEHPFTLSLKTWLAKHENSEQKRFSKGGLAPFRVFALDRITDLFYQDWNSYQKKDVAKTNKAFLRELDILHTLIREAIHLEPVRDSLVETLQRNLH